MELPKSSISDVQSVSQFRDEPTALSVPEQIRSWSERRPDAPAVLAHERPPLTYSQLWRQVAVTMNSLNQMGLGRGDRVALVMPNSPEMLVSFLGISAAGAVCAPLNPAYGEREFDFYFNDLKVKALVVQSRFGEVARKVALRLGVPIVELVPESEPQSGLFSLQGAGRKARSNTERARPEDVALMLHTSGTTSRPKMVPLSHKNLCASALNIARSLELRESDRCLDVMPLFHVHGLVGGALSSLVAGGSVVIVPRFDAEEFFQSLRDDRPTWYTAVPTMHQAVLSYVAESSPDLKELSLRLIRSCSAPLPPTVMERLERIFRVPVIEAYGMTEASHQIAINPLPPQQRKPGSVGLARGVEVALRLDDGRLVREGKGGEIVIRGQSVIAAYENNEQANNDSFIEGWFRTGDEGDIDQDGYIFLTGRLKELINRGGEKISPREIDEVILQHPSVSQAATFAVPHHTLGEDVAAAIVLATGKSTTEDEIRRFVATRVAEFKVPRQIIIVDAIPKGPTGKLQRLALAGLLRDKLKPEFIPPRTDTENQLAAIWAKLLDVPQIGIRDDFFALGGNSVIAARLLARINKVFGATLPMVTLIEAPTIEKLAEVLQGGSKSLVSSCLVPIQPQGSKPPFFCIHGPGGQVVNYAALASRWDRDQPFYGLQAQALVNPEQALHTTVEEMASHYITEIRTIQSRGPYFLGGFCFGGQIAFEMAQQLQRQGETVALVALMESFVRRFPRSMVRPRVAFYRNLGKIGRKVIRHFEIILRSQPWQAAVYFGRRIKNISILTRLSFLRGVDSVCHAFGGSLPKMLQPRDLALIHYQAGRSYVTERYPGPLVLVLAKETVETVASGTEENWGRLVDCLETHEMSCSHDDMLSEPNVQALAVILRKCIDRELGRVREKVISVKASVSSEQTGDRRFSVSAGS